MSKYKWGMLASLISLLAIVLSVAFAQADTGDVELVSVSSSGMQANRDSYFSSISSDGRFVAFTSVASNLVEGDTNNQGDVFVHDRQEGTTTRVSISSDGAQANGASMAPDISADGRFVTFLSDAFNLVDGDINNQRDVFVYDRQEGTTTRVSVSSDGTQANGVSWQPNISANGRFITFGSSATNLVGGDTNDRGDVFVHDRQEGTTTRVSVSSDGTQANGSSDSLTISDDGRFVAFNSLASNLVEGDDTTLDLDLFVHDRQEKTTIQIWKKVAAFSLSADGRFVVFHSTDAVFLEGDINAFAGIFIYDRQTNAVTRISYGSYTDAEPNSVSADGRFVAFSSRLIAIVEGDTNNSPDVFVYDRLTKTTTRVSVSSEGVEANSASMAPSISANGAFVTFESDATNLVEGDTNGLRDVFVYGMGQPSTPTPTPVVVESGFRLNEHAWNFPNRAFVPEEKHFVGAFGEDNARKFAGVVFSDGTGGACFGYAVTASLLVHGNSLGITPPVTPFVNTYAIPDPGTVPGYIIESYYRQFSIEYTEERAKSLFTTLNDKIDMIKQSVDDKFNSNPVIISLHNRSDDCSGHAVVPISYTVSLDGRTEVGVYDSNHPVGMNEQQTIIFDESNQSWSYTPRGENASFGSDVVCTNDNNQHLKGRIEILYAKTYSKPTNPPWWRMPVDNAWLEVSNWVVSIRDTAGNVLGDVGGEIVENIPNSFVFTPLDQLAGNPKSWYVVQADAPITATIQYNNSIDDAVTLFAHKAVFDVGLAKSGVTTDTLVIDSPGSAVSLFGGESRSITTTRLLTGTEQIFTLGMQESDQVRVQVFYDGSLRFFTATAQEVTLTLEQHGESGNAEYQLLLPPFAAGDAQIITPHWQEHSVTIDTDVGNDGTIDSTQTIQGETQQQSLYLPLVTR